MVPWEPLEGGKKAESAWPGCRWEVDGGRGPGEIGTCWGRHTGIFQPHHVRPASCWIETCHWTIELLGRKEAWPSETNGLNQGLWIARAVEQARKGPLPLLSTWPFLPVSTPCAPLATT